MCGGIRQKGSYWDHIQEDNKMCKANYMNDYLVYTYICNKRDGTTLLERFSDMYSINNPRLETAKKKNEPWILTVAQKLRDIPT